METNTEDEDILYTLASECEGMFVDVHEALEKTGSATAVHELCTEFQERFATWTAHLGVFARKSQCLDTRLRNFPDLQDLTVRLLDILRRCLYQWKSVTCRPSEEQVEHVQITLQGIDDTLSRLNNLGVTIRQSSAGKVDLKAREIAMGTDSNPFGYLCMQAIHALYPGASQALKDWLIQSMTIEWGGIIHAGLETIPRTPTGATQTAPKATRSLAVPLRSHTQTPLAPSTQSDLSSVNIQQLRSRNRPPDELSTGFVKTLSVQVKRGNYPKPPDREEGGTYFTCQWCSESIDRKTLTDSAWQRHIDRDLRPYICLSGDCPGTNKYYPNFSRWFEHMQLHDRRWHQKLYPKPSWVCTVCQSGYQAYDTPQALYSHLQQSHRDDFTEPQLQVISRQSKTEQQRARNDCLLCSFTVEVENNKEYEAGYKRRKGRSANEATKSARTSLATRNAGPHGHSSRGSNTTSDSDSDSISESEINEPGHIKDGSEAVARHVASHLQMLMLLTLRFAALTNDIGIDDDEVNSDSVEIDEEDNTMGSNSEMGSMSDLDVEKNKEGLADDALGPNEDIRNDDTTIPDCDIEIIIPTRYDNLAAKDDDFLQGVIGSGAYQSWRIADPAFANPTSFNSRPPSSVYHGPSTTNSYGSYQNRGSQGWDMPGRYSPTHSVDGILASPNLSDYSLENGMEPSSGNGKAKNGGGKNRPQRKPSNRDEFDGPHQFLARPPATVIAMQERELPHLPTNLHIQEQGQVLSKVNDRLSQCAFDFVAKYQFPIPLTQDMRPVERPQDREWTEWVYLLKRLATKRRIPARVLYNGQIKQFVTILENSLEMRHAAKHQSRPLKDDRNILQLISAGIQVAKILKDAAAMDYLDQLYVSTEKQIQERTSGGETLGLQVMERRQHVLGEEHPDTLRSMANLAATYHSQDRATDRWAPGRAH